MALPLVHITGTILTPDGDPVASGTIVATLSAPISVSDGVTTQRIAGSTIVKLGADGVLPDGTGGKRALDLVPNDAGTPVGTYYDVLFTCRTPGGVEAKWREVWEIASAPASLAIGDVTRRVAAPAIPGWLQAAPVYTTATLPTASAAWRGRPVRVKDPGADEAVMWCVLLADGATHEWRSLRGGVTLPEVAPSAPTLSVTSPTKASPVPLSGTAEKYATVLLYVDGALTTATVAGADGAWSANLTVDEGSFSLSARASNAAGIGDPCAGVPLVVDRTAPDAPAISSPATGTTTSASEDVAVTAEAGSTVVVNVDGVTYPTTESPAGTFTAASVPWVIGSNAIRARATDAVGNVSAWSSTVTRTYTVTLAAPAITAPAPASLIVDATFSMSTSHVQSVAGRTVRFWRSSTTTFADAIDVAQATTGADGSATNAAVPIA